jgi:hypothetical protein
MRDYQKINKILLSKPFKKIEEALDDFKSNLYLNKELTTAPQTCAVTFEEMFLSQVEGFGKVISRFVEEAACRNGKGGYMTVTGSNTLDAAYDNYWTVTITVSEQGTNVRLSTVPDAPADSFESAFELPTLRSFLNNQDFITNVSVCSFDEDTLRVLFDCSGSKDNDCILINHHYGMFDVPVGSLEAIGRNVEEYLGTNQEFPEQVPASLPPVEGQPVETPQLTFHENIARPARRGKIIEKQIFGMKISEREIQEAEELEKQIKMVTAARRKAKMEKLFESGKNEIYSKLIGE